MLFALLLACSPSPERGDLPATTDTAPTDAAPRWDPSPVAAERGSILRMTVDCGLLDGNPVREFRKIEDAGSRWEMLIPEQPDVHPEVLPCTTPSEDYLDWLADGRLEVLASDLWHELEPSPLEGTWVGTTWPLSGSSPDCDASLAELGLEWPVVLAMSLVEVLPSE